MAPSSRIVQVKRIRRIVAWTVSALVVVLVGAFLADNFAASRAEHRMARAVMSSPKVTYEPEVTIHAFPFLTKTSGPFSAINVSARGVAVPDCGSSNGRSLCTADLDARLIDADLGNVWDVKPATPIVTSGIEASTRVDSVNLGRLMNITDLYINTPAPEDKPGGGGPGDGLLERSHGVMLSGTVPLPGSPERVGKYPPSASEYTEPKAKVSVQVDVSVVDGRVVIKAYDFYTGPEEHFSDPVPAEFRAAVLDRFSMVLPLLPAAWNIYPTRAFSRGSDLIMTTTVGPRTVEPRNY